ncbi:MAG: efflux RND transporter periplasmic adaptor subunit [Bacteroidia bacterium]|nr:efflux RND transporter periplasmic adaptor subunit [Bacteroidia bacterium]
MHKLLAGMLLTVLISFLSCSGGKENAREGAKTPKVSLTVDGKVVMMSSKDLSYSYTGSLLANEEIDIRPEISAKVTKILFQEGTKVNKGQLLVKMFDADLQAQLKKNKLQIELKTKEFERKKELLKLNGISKEEFETSENGLNTLIAEQDLLYAQISKTELNAPFSGIVGLRMVSEGSFVTNTTVITSLQQIDPIKVEFSIPEKYKQYLNENMEIKFTIEGIDRIYSARIYALESKIDAETRSIRIRALAPNPDRSLFPGSFVSIKLNLFPDKETIFITARAIVPLINGEQVFIVRNGKVDPVKVITGIRTETEVEILKGLQVNDTLIISGLLQVKEDMPVRVRIAK